MPTDSQKQSYDIDARVGDSGMSTEDVGRKLKNVIGLKEWIRKR
jgi:hypothetical protein